jgi:NADP-reducing hydrogenase subunit HndD
MPKITINGKTVQAKRGASIFEAAYDQGIQLPNLCFMKGINEIGYCRMCVVEVNNNKDLIASCITPVKRGMDIQTHSTRVRDSRTSTLAILATRHKFNCWACARGDGSCDFYEYLKDYHVSDDMFKEPKGRFAFVVDGAAINMDEHKCVLCRRCVSTCSEIVTAKVFKYRDENPEDPIVSPAPGLSFDEAGCISCGACTIVCPVGALIETDHIKQVERALRDANTYVVAQLEPTVKAALGETFGYAIGEGVAALEGKIQTALMELGFDEVQYVDDAADVHAVEQAKAFLASREADHNKPFFTSSNAGWIRYIEMYEPDHLDHLSPLKSPHLMNAILHQLDDTPLQAANEGETAKPKSRYVVTITPSTAAKYEIGRNEHAGLVQAVLTTREFGRMILKTDMRFKRLEPTGTPRPMTAGSMYGVVGGELIATMEQVAALKGETLTLSLATFHRFDHDITEAVVKIGKEPYRVAVVHGGKAMAECFKRLKSGKKTYDFIEFSDTFGGLITGGGQPIVSEEFLFGWNLARMRTQGYVKNYKINTMNPFVASTYETTLDEPGSPMARKLFATSFSKKPYTRK